MSTPSEERELRKTSPHDAVICDNVVVAIHRHGPAEPALAAQLSALDRATGANPDGVGFLLILVEGAKTPDPEGRRRITNTFAGLGPKLRGVAIVMAGAGFWASAVRSTVAVLLISIARGYQARIFASTSEAAVWLASQVKDCKKPATADELRVVADELVAV